MDVLQILHLPIRNRRDLLRVRQRARQIARLLRFDALDQIEIAAQAFRLAGDAARTKPRQAVVFQLSAAFLAIGTADAAVRRGERITAASGDFRQSFVKSLVARLELSLEDFSWMLAQAAAQPYDDMWEELHLSNDETLGLLNSLRCCRSELNQPRPASKNPAA